jgi:hypothetical protein
VPVQVTVDPHIHLMPGDVPEEFFVGGIGPHFHTPLALAAVVRL